MHVGLFVTASQGHTVRPSNSFGAESGGDGLPDQLFPQGVRHKFGLIQLAECVAFRHGNHARIRHAGG